MTTDVKLITPEKLGQLQANGQPMELLDVRTPAEFRELHVAGARNVPLDRLDCDAVMASRELSSDQPLYVICRSGSRGRQACEQFLAAGHDNVLNVDGGTLACDQANLSVVRGKKTMSLERQVRIVAGFLIVLGVVLGWCFQPWMSGLAAFVGAGLMFAGITDSCAMGMLMAKMPWNQVSDTCAVNAG